MPHNVFQTQLSWGSAASFLDIEAWPRGREGPGEPRGGGGGSRSSRGQRQGQEAVGTPEGQQKPAAGTFKEPGDVSASEPSRGGALNTGSVRREKVKRTTWKALGL